MIPPLFQRILVVINGSEASVSAAKYAILMAKQYHCSVSAVYVIDTATIKYLTLNKFFIQEESYEYETSLEENGTRYLDYVEELAKSKGVKVEKILKRGSICDEIVALAQAENYDAILLGGWEKSQIATDVISRQAREILLDSHCSVLVVKAPEIDKVFKLA